MSTKARIENGVVVEVLTADPFPPFHPSLHWVDCDLTVRAGWLFDGANFKIDPLALSAGQTSKKQQIDDWRDAACVSNVSVTLGGAAHQFQADQRSQALISGAIVGAVAGISAPPSIWRSVDNINVPITIADLKAIGLAMVDQTNVAYEHSWALKAAVDAAATQADLDAIVW